MASLKGLPPHIARYRQRLRLRERRARGKARNRFLPPGKPGNVADGGSLQIRLTGESSNLPQRPHSRLRVARPREVILRTFAGIVALLVATASSAAPPHVTDGMLVDQHGMTLYVFGGKGPPDATSCEGHCERNFPPAVAVQGDTPTDSLTLIATPTGERQWAYKGQPLYHGLMDKKPGDHQADGLNGIWHPVRP